MVLLDGFSSTFIKRVTTGAPIVRRKIQLKIEMTHSNASEGLNIRHEVAYRY